MRRSYQRPACSENGCSRAATVEGTGGWQFQLCLLTLQRTMLPPIQCRIATHYSSILRQLQDAAKYPTSIQLPVGTSYPSNRFPSKRLTLLAFGSFHPPKASLVAGGSGHPAMAQDYCAVQDENGNTLRNKQWLNVDFVGTAVPRSGMYISPSPSSPNKGTQHQPNHHLIFLPCSDLLIYTSFRQAFPIIIA